MVEISLSGSGEGPGRATGRGYSTFDAKTDLTPEGLSCTAFLSPFCWSALGRARQDIWSLGPRETGVSRRGA